MLTTATHFIIAGDDLYGMNNLDTESEFDSVLQTSCRNLQRRQVNSEFDSLQTNCRKLQRRQANRKSAQLSRARKKAHLEDLKEENTRLQHMVDILDSQAEFIFSFTAKGDITYIPTRILNQIKSASDDTDEEITCVGNILTPDSVDILMESLGELSGNDAEQTVTFVKEVYYQDATGFPVAGFMRCSRLVRRERNFKEIDYDCSDSETIDKVPSEISRKRKNSSLNDEDQMVAQKSKSHSETEDDAVDEFICVIRPVSSSSPHSLNNLHLLSAAAMVAHDSRQKMKIPTDRARDRRNLSASSSCMPSSSHSTEQTKNSTTSEDRSEDSTNSNCSDENSNDP